MTSEQDHLHGQAEDERNRSKREQRVKDATAEFARVRALACLNSTAEVADPGEDGCYW